ncbi:MAG: YkoF family thiamine/hydroxymethylpyrimidine-binding protein [Pseudomonadota bacterium]
MQARVELSLYPLADDYISIIKAFIERLNSHAGIDVVTNPMSTQVTGDYDEVMALITDELRISFDHSKAVCVMKVLPLL